MANVLQTISLVKRDLGAVAKGNRMEAGPAKYQYRSIDDVLNQLHAGMVEHGLVIIPSLHSCIQEPAGETRSGTKQTRTVVEMGYLIGGPEGDILNARTVGEAIDSGDKGTNKAGTSAFKQLLTQLLAIPFDTNDPDHEHTEVVRENRPKPAASAKPAAPAASTPKAPSKPVSSAAPAKPAAATGSATGGRTCPTCTYAIGPRDTVKKGPDRTFHHTACLDGVADSGVTSTAGQVAQAPIDPNDISAIIGD